VDDPGARFDIKAEAGRNGPAFFIAAFGGQPSAIEQHAANL
jgi:hypothetical protein